MNFAVKVKTCVGVTLALGGVVWLVSGIASCGTAPTPFIVQGPGVTGNQPPAFDFIEPNENVSLALGTNFVIRWTDTDRDSNASISIWLVNTETNQAVLLEGDIQENDDVDSRTFSTDLIPVGRYNVLGVIDDDVNSAVSVYAITTAAAVDERVILNITPPGQGPQTQPPIITVTEPAFNLSVAQEDTLRVWVQPTAAEPDDTTPPFDPDSDITLYFLLDTDLDPNNDDPANPDPSKIIVLQQQTVVRGTSARLTYDAPIDLDRIPPRAAGEPYYVRATADDLTNPRVHQYAVGTISVVQLATGSVDLFNIGRTTSGVRFYGFTPSANLGAKMSHIGDFDADGVDDFILVAQFGNPRNFGPVGEAYGIYGQTGIRFGGALSVNSVGETISGVIFPAPRVRSWRIGWDPDPWTDGITDVNFIDDLSGDGRPEIMFGLSHVFGAFDTTDWDPDDADIDASDTTVDIEVVIQQSNVLTTVGDAAPIRSTTYRGIDDLTISSADPNLRLGTELDVSFVNDGPGQREWGLIKFRNVLQLIPDTGANIDVQGIRATLDLRVFRTGGDGGVRQCFTDFSEQTSFSTFASNGQEPVDGEDYAAAGTAGAVGTVDGGTAEIVTIDVSGLVRQLVDGLLEEYNNELRLIIVPSDDEGTARTSFRSSESIIESDRPTLRITYTRTDFAGAWDCYPDNLVNNFTDEGDDLEHDLYFYAGGMVTVVNSQNRDILAPRPNPTRLESTVVDLELVGARVQDVSYLAGQIMVRADNSQAQPLGNEQTEEGRISGFRIIPGGFDYMDARFLRQPAREGYFGQTVASLGDQNSDGLDEIMISAPQNERYLRDLRNAFGGQGTHLASTRLDGSITVLPGNNYNDNDWRDKGDASAGTSTIPLLDQHLASLNGSFGSCSASDPVPRHTFQPLDWFSVFAEDIDDWLGGARSAGDFNQDGLDDILCGAPLNDRTSALRDTGAVYVLYGRNVIGDFDLELADDPIYRPPMLRIRGGKAKDRIGWTQVGGLDVNGDRIEDIFISSPTTDFGGITRPTCAGDFNRDGSINASDLNAVSFDQCETEIEIFTDDACKVFDYNNTGRIDEEDNEVFNCLRDGGTNCCANLVDNGFVGVIFGGVFTDGDRTINQIATTDLPGTVFFGSSPGDLAGWDISSAGDFNKDGFGDILIAAPGETQLDRAGRPRLGVVYLIFGGTHLTNTSWNLSEVGSEDLPGLVFLSPYAKGRPNEAAPESVAFIGDINDDGFGDIAIGNPKADFMDLSFPQGPEATDSQVGRRSNAGDVYIVYGNNFGTNRGGGG